MHIRIVGILLVFLAVHGVFVTSNTFAATSNTPQAVYTEFRNTLLRNNVNEAVSFFEPAARAWAKKMLTNILRKPDFKSLQKYGHAPAERIPLPEFGRALPKNLGQLIEASKDGKYRHYALRFCLDASDVIYIITFVRTGSQWLIHNLYLDIGVPGQC